MINQEGSTCLINDRRRKKRRPWLVNLKTTAYTRGRQPLAPGLNYLNKTWDRRWGGGGGVAIMKKEKEYYIKRAFGG